MSGKMSMMFSQNGGMVWKNAKKVMPASVSLSTGNASRQVSALPPAAQTQARGGVGGMPNRSAPRNVKQLFNLGHIMANPGTPCKACGS
jgi:hypothetical protein